MIVKATTCCFTGHREAKLPWLSYEDDSRCLELKKRLFDTVEAVYLSGARHFICGMANGTDMYFGEAVLKLRDMYGDLTLEAAIPYEGQASRWPERLRTRWQAIASRCDYKTVIQAQYTSGCMMRRNRYMVDSSSVIIAVYNGSPGGTMQTLLYAMRSKLEIIELPI